MCSKCEGGLFGKQSVKPQTSRGLLLIMKSKIQGMYMNFEYEVQVFLLCTDGGEYAKKTTNILLK